MSTVFSHQLLTEKLRRTLLGDLYDICAIPPGISRDELQTQLTFIQLQGMMEGCTVDDLAKVCDMKTKYVPTCSRDRQEEQRVNPRDIQFERDRFAQQVKEQQRRWELRKQQRIPRRIVHKRLSEIDTTRPVSSGDEEDVYVDYEGFGGFYDGSPVNSDRE